MSDLAIEIEELYFAGLSVSEIQNITQMPESWIRNIIENADESV